MALDDGGALLDQLPRGLLPLKGDKAEVLGSITSQLVHRPDHLHHRTKLKRRIANTDSMHRATG